MDEAKQTRHIMAGILWEKNRRGQRMPRITPENWDDVLATGPTSFPERVDRLLLNLELKSSSPGSNTSLSSDLDWPIAFAESKDAFTYAFQTLRDQKLIDYDHPSGTPPNDAWFRLTYLGWKRVQELRTQGPGSPHAFIALTRRPDGKDIEPRMEGVLRQGIEEGIRVAGFAPIFAEDQQHAERIDDRILVDIKRSRFVVADTTGRNPNVLFEAGYALGLGKTVIWTCREEDHYGAVPFDIRQYKRLPWQFGQEAKLADELRFAIENVVGPGPHKGNANPIRSALEATEPRRR